MKYANKSFSVSMVKDAVAECYDCKKELEVVQYRKNGNPHCLDCFRKGSGRIAEGNLNFHVDSFSTPRWNQGLGCYTSSIHDTEKKAKRRGLTPIGDARIEQVFKPGGERQSSKSIAQEIIRDFHKERRRIVIQ